MAKPYVFAGYGNYKLALDAAYAHFDKDEQAYAGGEDFSSVTVDDVLANERLLTFFKTRYFGKQGKGVPSPSLFRALCSASQLSGAWTAVYASVTPHRPYCSRTVSGRSSGSAPAAENACRMQAQSVRLDSPAVSGYTGSSRFVTVPGLPASSKAGFAICMPCPSSVP